MRPSLQPAFEFMVAAHRGQTRRHSGLPYHTHPQRVAELIAGVLSCPSDEVLIAALLHDTVEDTAVRLSDIETRFGLRVAAIVNLVTHQTSHKLDTLYRLRGQYQRDRDLAEDAFTVFLADKASNALDLYSIANSPARSQLSPRAEGQLRRQLTWITQAVAGYPFSHHSELNALVRLAEFHVSRTLALLGRRP